MEQVILDLDLQAVKLERDTQMRRILSRLQAQVPILTAEKIYRWLCEHPAEGAEFFREEPLFMWDDHLKWIPVKETQNQERRNDSITTDTRTAMIGCHEADTGEEGEQEDIDEHWSVSGRANGRKSASMPRRIWRCFPMSRDWCRQPAAESECNAAGPIRLRGISAEVCGAWGRDACQ